MSFDLFVYVPSFDASMQQAWLRALEARGVRCVPSPGFSLLQYDEDATIDCTIGPPLVREPWPVESVGHVAQVSPVDEEARAGLVEGSTDPVLAERARAATLEFHFHSSAGRSNAALLLQCYGAAALAEVANGVLMDPQEGVAVTGDAAYRIARHNSDWALPATRAPTPAPAPAAPPAGTLPPHMKTARAHAALSWFYGAVGLLFCLFPYFVLTASRRASMQDVLIASITPLLFLSLCVLHRVIASAARARKPWARVATLVIGCLALFAFPVGTLIGVYLLVNSSWGDTKPG